MFKLRYIDNYIFISIDKRLFTYHNDPHDKFLVIVESPAKSKTIHKFLGKDYKILASYGHIRDLPSGDMGIDLENGFTPKYVTIKDKTKLIKELKAEAKKLKLYF